LKYGPWAEENVFLYVVKIKLEGGGDVFTLNFAVEDQDVKLKLD
jgi:hypothetical protein